MLPTRRGDYCLFTTHDAQSFSHTIKSTSLVSPIERFLPHTCSGEEVRGLLGRTTSSLSRTSSLAFATPELARDNVRHTNHTLEIMSSGPTVLPSAFGSPATTSDRNGIIPSMQPSGARSSWTPSSQNGRSVSYNFRGGRAPLPYIKDLQDQAAHLEVDETSPVCLISKKWSWNYAADQSRLLRS